MAFYLGRDVKVYLTTEDGTNGCVVDASGNSLAFQSGAPSAGEYWFAGPRTLAGTVSGQVNSLTSCDISIGAMDEDITYFGFRQVTKAEIKKETTVSITKTKGDNIWDTVFNEAGRWGCSGTNALTGLTEPAKEIGYRIYVEMASGSSAPEVFTLPNAVIAAHTVSMNVDGSAEETLEFSSNVTPIASGAAYIGQTDASAL